VSNTFQRRHYVALAEIVRVAKLRPNDSPAEAITDLQEDLADFLAANNPSFDRDRFVAACQPREGAR
jgi:hypothetical protein